MLDIDFFKRVNDELGHAAGDEVLCQVAIALQTTMRNTDLAARVGGEEFAVILTETDGPGALLWTKRLEVELSQLAWKHRSVTLSMGIARLTPDIIECSQMVEQSDDALYCAKRAGRARAIVYGATPVSVHPIKRMRVG